MCCFCFVLTERFAAGTATVPVTRCIHEIASPDVGQIQHIGIPAEIDFAGITNADGAWFGVGKKGAVDDGFAGISRGE